MQSLQSTFDGVVARHPLPPGGATPPSRYNPHDAIYAAAYYLCDSGAPKDLRKAIFAYNHADWYVDDVLAQAKKYGDALVVTGDCKNIQAPTPAAIMAINVACGQLGLPYVWGGNGPAGGHAGFDCSGLTTAASMACQTVPPRIPSLRSRSPLPLFGGFVMLPWRICNPRVVPAVITWANRSTAGNAHDQIATYGHRLESRRDLEESCCKPPSPPVIHCLRTAFVSTSAATPCGRWTTGMPF